MIGFELAAAVLLGLFVLWTVLGPLAFREREEPEPEEPAPVEETARGQALVALGEIEFDHATGKLSDEDYAELKRRQGRRALALLDVEESEAEALVTRFVEAASGPVRCPTCGPRPEADAAFCSRCGQPIGASGARCAACSSPLPPGARFCTECGREAPLAGRSSHLES